VWQPCQRKITTGCKVHPQFRWSIVAELRANLVLRFAGVVDVKLNRNWFAHTTPNRSRTHWLTGLPFYTLAAF
jgi:hypothetical protein